MEHTILEKKQLSEQVYMMRIEAPLIAEARSPGQFIILQIDTDFGERIPLTIADASAEEGWIRIIFQAVGGTTMKLSAFEEGQAVAAVLGPLGHPTHIENFGRAVCVAGGIGVAPMFPIAQALKHAGNHLTVIIGARNRELVILEEEMKEIADETQPLEELCESDTPPDIAVAIGPPIMMKSAAETTRPYDVHTMVSLNTIMVDGTGMCGGCRVTVGGETKFVCVDGPEFDGHQVDFDNMMKRLASYKPQEEKAKHACLVDREADKLAAEQNEPTGGHVPVNSAPASSGAETASRENT